MITAETVETIVEAALDRRDIGIKKQFKYIDGRFEQIGEEFQKVYERFDKMDERLGKMLTAYSANPRAKFSRQKIHPVPIKSPSLSSRL